MVKGESVTDWQGLGFMAFALALMLGVISAFQVIVSMVGSFANGVVSAVGDFSITVVDTLGVITPTLLICAACVAGLAVVGLTVREVTRLRAGTLVELTRMECEAIEEKS